MRAVSATSQLGRLGAAADPSRLAITLRGALLRSAFARDTALVMLGTGLGQGLNLISSPVLTRLYSPELFGSLGVLLSMYSVLTPLACWRYEQAIMVTSSDREAASVWRLAGALNLLMVVISTVAVLTIGRLVAEALGRPAVADWLWAVPLLLLLAGAYQTLRLWLGRRRRFGTIAAGRVSRGGISNAAPILAASFLGASAAGLIGGYLTGLAAEVVVLLAQACRSSRLHPGVHVRGASGELRSAAMRYRKFPLFAVPGTLSNLLAIEAPTLLLAAFFSPAEVGLYWLSYRLLALPTSLAGEAVSTVFYQRLSAMRASGRSGAALTTQVFVLLLGVGLIPMAAIGIAAPTMFGLIFGSEWEAAGHYARALVPAELMLFVAYPLTQAFFVYEKQEVGLLWNIGFLAMSAVSFAGGAYFAGALAAVQWYSLGSVIMYGLVVVMAFAWSGGRLREVRSYLAQGVHEVLGHD
jgi:O-antigen/teichoic acid export membrane protein